jgi:hypothetical protein
MNLTGLQKQIVGDILDGKINDIESFIRLHLRLIPATLKPGLTMGLIDNYSIGSSASINTVVDEHEALSQLRQFAVLWNQLEKADLVYSLPRPKRAPFPLFKNEEELLPKAMHLIGEYTRKEIIAYPELLEFVRNDFSTFDEMKLQEDVAYRKESLRLTRRVAYVSLGISIALAIVTILFNYLTFTTDRVVTIRNPGAFSDTTKVLILREQENAIPFDSIKGE